MGCSVGSIRPPLVCSEDLAASEMTLSTVLCVTLIPVKHLLEASDIPTLRAAVHNAAPYPITILTYNSLLDKAAGVLGIIHVIDSSTENEATSDVAQFRRVWPPSQDAFVEIAPNDTLEVVIPLRTHKVEGGKKYDVRAKWEWQGIWKGGLDEVMKACLEDDTTAGSWNGPSTELRVEGAFEVQKV